MTTDYIAIDWGSTNFRAWWYQGESCHDYRSIAAGITQLNGQSPASVFARVTEGWPTLDLPVMMAGMVGSNVGWKNAPYLPCPVSFNDIPGRLTTISQRMSIIPGISVQHPDNTNVMRGEETQLIGARHLAPASLYIFPGTHCKWVHADKDKIHNFRTVMTGELHHLLLTASLLGAHLPAQKENESAYQRGLERGLETSAPLAALFEIRAMYLLNDLGHEEVSEYLSGLLIGHEVASMVRYWQPRSQQPITIVAAHSLANRYQRALNHLGYSVQLVEGDYAFQAGIRSIVNAMAN